MTKLAAPPEQILQEAMRAAHDAATALVAKNPGVWFPCGFAWVKIKPARGPFVAFLKERGVGHTDTFAGGYTIWDPANLSSQWMVQKYEGAAAFAAVLNKYGIKAYAESRMD